LPQKAKNGGSDLHQTIKRKLLLEIRATASGYPAPSTAAALINFGANEKFVRKLAEATPLGRRAVF
jgi:hypothetical protein